MENIKDTGDANQAKSIKFRLGIISIEINGYKSEELETVAKFLSSKTIGLFVWITVIFIVTIVPDLIKSFIELWHGSP